MFLKKKGLLMTVLVLVLSFSIVLGVGAEQLQVREKFINQLINISRETDEGFLRYVTGKVFFQVKRLEGSLVDELPKLDKSEVVINYKVNAPNQKAFYDLQLKVDGEEYTTQCFMCGDRVIFTKNILDILSLIGSSPNGVSMDLDYLYIDDESLLANMWEVLVERDKEKVTQDTKKILDFLVEAIPRKYFSFTGSKVVLELDQAGFEDVLYHVLQKIQAEPERFADIVVNNTGVTAIKMSDEQEQMRADIVDDIKEAVAADAFPGKIEIGMLSKFLQVKKFVYELSIIPGGKRSFNAEFRLHPNDPIAGQVKISSVITGMGENLQKEHNFELDMVVEDNIGISTNILFGTNYLKDERISTLELAGLVADLNTGETLLYMEAVGGNTEQITPDVEISIPVLTEDNSMPFDCLAPGQSEFVPQKRSMSVFVGKEKYVTNNKEKTLDVPPYIRDGRTMVPIRFVAEGLGAEVSFNADTEEIHIYGESVIRLQIDQKSYTVDGIEKQMDVAPYIKDGRTMVPVRFVAEGLGAEVSFNADTKEISINIE